MAPALQSNSAGGGRFMYKNKRLTVLIAWLFFGFLISSYYNACSKVAFDPQPAFISQSLFLSPNTKVDILVIMDNSGSMAGEMSSMANRFGSFTNRIVATDWQLGIITTDNRTTVSYGNGKLIPLTGVSNQFIINPLAGLAAAEARFSQSIQMPTNGYGTESGFSTLISALNRSKSTAAENAPNKQLIRSDAALSVVIVSDAADSSMLSAQDVVNTVKSLYPNKTFTVNALVVPENDPCNGYRESSNQDGRKYHDLAELTGGILGTVCTNDYGSQLNEIGGVTASLVNSITLNCQPTDSNHDGLVNAADVQIRTANGAAVTGYEVSGRRVTFTQQLPSGSNEFQYFCLL